MLPLQEVFRSRTVILHCTFPQSSTDTANIDEAGKGCEWPAPWRALALCVCVCGFFSVSGP